jgi:hypothetical protein
MIAIIVSLTTSCIFPCYSLLLFFVFFVCSVVTSLELEYAWNPLFVSVRGGVAGG